MQFASSTIFILVVMGFAAYLIYSQQQSLANPLLFQQLQQPQQPKQSSCPPCSKCVNHQPQPQPVPQITNVNVQTDDDPYSDSIKKQDLYTMYDPLTYPQLRLPREVLDSYNEYYERTGTYPPFNMATQPKLFDNPILNGLLYKICDDIEPFNDNIPSSVPLFRVKSVKNANRYFYYVVDQRYLSKIEMKIPLDNVKVNGKIYPNADFYGLPELFDDDIITNIPIYPEARFRVSLYKTYHFP